MKTERKLMPQPRVGMRTTSFVALALTLVFGISTAAVAETDENGQMPKHWYKFDGNLNSSGETALTISGENGASYAEGVSDQAYAFENGYHPYGSGMSRGTGDFTVVTVAKTANLDHGIVWAQGSSGTSRGFALTAVGDDKVAVRKFGADWGGDGDIITANVPDASEKYHVYTLVYRNSGFQFALYVGVPLVNSSEQCLHLTRTRNLRGHPRTRERGAPALHQRKAPQADEGIANCGKSVCTCTNDAMRDILAATSWG